MFVLDAFVFGRRDLHDDDDDDRTFGNRIYRNIIVFGKMKRRSLHIFRAGFTAQMLQ